MNQSVNNGFDQFDSNEGLELNDMKDGLIESLLRKSLFYFISHSINFKWFQTWIKYDGSYYDILIKKRGEETNFKELEK